jgi:hypothetical protein
VGGVLAQNAVYALWTTFGRATEAAQGLIPVLTLRHSQAIPIASRNGEISYQPVLEITGWTTRDPSVFGPRTVPPPQTRLGSDGAAAAIAAPEPAELPQPVPVILPPEQHDPFSTMMPLGNATAGAASAVAPAVAAASAIAVPPADTVTVAAPSAAPKF